MSRFAITGNSHAGKFYTAFKNIRSDFGFSADFFIERSKGTFPLRITGAGQQHSFEDVLLMNEAALSVENYDAVVVVGLGIGLDQAVLPYNQFRSVSHVDQAANYLVSDACFRDSVKGIYEASKASRIIHALRAVSAKRIVLAPAPYPMEWVKDRDGQEYRSFGAISSSGDDRALNGLLLKYFDGLADLGVTIVPQPAATVVGNCYTKTQYGVADPAEKDDPSSYYAKGDYKHGNVEFAHAHLNDIVNVLMSDSASRIVAPAV